jgi:curved DNA-binding protein CbpA
VPTTGTGSNQTLYEILGVSPTATQAEIKSAYRHLSKVYHPDLNPSPEAIIRMKEINHAYDVLKNPARRAAYDLELGVEEVTKHEPVDSVEYAESFAREVRCQGCGKFDHTLRVVAFPYVFSILIMSFKRYEAGIFCDHCRARKSTKWTIISLLFGIWGFPFGIYWTIESLIINSKKGKKPQEENQQLLQQLAWVNAILGRIDEAKASLRDLLKYGPNEDAKQFQDELDRRYPTIPPAKVSGFHYGFTIAVIAILALYVFIGNAIFGGAPESTSSTRPPDTPATTPTSQEPATFLIPPEDYFVQWQNDSGWISETTIEINGKVTNTHNDWTITEVEVVIELLDEYDKTIQEISIPISPSTIPPNGSGTYSKLITAPYTCEAANTILYWVWQPPE